MANGNRSLGRDLVDLFFGGSLIRESVAAIPHIAARPDQQMMTGLADQAKAWNINAFDPSTALYGQEPTALTSEECRAIARMDKIAALINVRIRKWKACGHQQQDRGTVGYVVGTRDPKQHNTKATQKKIAEIQRVLERGEPFAVKMEKWGRDSHEIDRAIGQVLFDETPRSPNYGKPIAFTAEDGAKFRWAMPTDAERNQGRLDLARRPVVQWVYGRPVEAFAREQILWIQRNNRTDIEIQGYGYSEIEMAAGVIDSLWKADEFNTRFFENGVHAAFILKVRAQMSPEMWESLQRQISEKLKGVRNAHKFAAILLRSGQAGISPPEDIDKVDLAGSPKDMEFRWAYSFYYRVIAAIMGIDLEEAGLSDPADTGRATLQEANTEWKLLQSHASGLMPGLSAVRMEVNERVIWPIDPDFAIRFEGLSSMTPFERAELDAKMGQFLMPYNELRRTMDMNPVKWTYEHPEDECPIGYAQLYLQFMQMQQAKAMQEQQMEMAQQQAGEAGGGEPDPTIEDFDDSDTGEGGDGPATAKPESPLPTHQWHREPGPSPKSLLRSMQ